MAAIRMKPHRLTEITVNRMENFQYQLQIILFFTLLVQCARATSRHYRNINKIIYRCPLHLHFIYLHLSLCICKRAIL